MSAAGRPRRPWFKGGETGSDTISPIFLRGDGNDMVATPFDGPIQLPTISIRPLLFQLVHSRMPL